MSVYPMFEISPWSALFFKRHAHSLVLHVLQGVAYGTENAYDHDQEGDHENENDHRVQAFFFCSTCSGSSAAGRGFSYRLFVIFDIPDHRFDLIIAEVGERGHCRSVKRADLNGISI